MPPHAEPGCLHRHLGRVGDVDFDILANRLSVIPPLPTSSGTPLRGGKHRNRASR